MYDYCSPKQIKPGGWLLKQLEIEAHGLAGNLDKIWPDVRESAWIGGDKEGWERVPYWLDGFIPLAFLLDDEDMKQRARRYVSAIAGFQQEDGWICPCSPEKRKSYDIWSWFLIAKVFALYCEYTDDKMIESALYRTVKCMYEMAQKGELSLFSWGKFRWYECFIPLTFLYEKYPENWILELGVILKQQGADYSDYCELWKRPLNHWKLETHIVNIAMMLKAEAVSCHLLGDACTDRAEYFWQLLERYNGTAVGVFTGDECLSGIGNNHGTELCSVVELMYSCEILYGITGNDIWLERLEKMAFNALPASMSDDMWTHQYDQQVNQISCMRFPGKSFFRTNSGESHLFGLEPNFGCRTANHGQGWPKLAMSIFQKKENSIQVTMMLPCELHTKIQEADVTVRIDTQYPFRHSGTFTVMAEQPTEFELKFRIPKWAKKVYINGRETENCGYYSICKVWNGTESIPVEFEDTPHFVTRPYDLFTVEYGPLVFALPLDFACHRHEYEKDGVERKFPYCDYELERKGEWRFGFSGEKLEVSKAQGDEIPFSSKHPSVSIKASFQRIAWDYADGYETVAEKYPESNVPLSEPQEMVMIPYGCAKLRMTEMPRV